MANLPSVDELLRRWQGSTGRDRPATIEDLCAGDVASPADLKERLRAVAAMMAFLGIDAEQGPVGARPTDGDGSDGSSSTAIMDHAGAGEGQPGLTSKIRIPGYEILGELGRGGMGVVYRARQQSLDRVVALKMILASSLASPTAIARFLHEARTIALLTHPHIVQVFDYGSYEGKPYFSLEYLESGSLADALRGEPQDPARAAAMVEVLAQAVQVAHEQGIVHRDLKPGNVLLATDGTPKITDFGVAKRGDSVMTATGDVLGTPSYMAPEQAAGQTDRVGPAADIYALGAILYEMLTGRPPFRGASAWETIQFVIHTDPVAPRQLQPMVPRDVETICLKCLEKEPARRYAAAEDLAGDLRRYRSGEPILARAVGPLERTARWGRRNKAVAASLAVVALSLLAALVVSSVAGYRAEQARKAAARRALSEEQARREAVEARLDVQRQLIDLSNESGLAAARDGDHALALLWFARTAQLSGGDPEREDLSRTRYANWLRHVWTPEGKTAVPGFRRNQGRFRHLAFSPDGRYLLAIDGEAGCLLWDRPGGRLVPLPGPATGAKAAAWEPRTGLLAVGGREGRIRLLAPPAFTPVEECSAEGDVAVLAFSRDGRRLAWGGGRGARVWDRQTKRYGTPLLPHGGPVATLAFSSDGERLATSARDLKARVFRAASDRPDPVFPPVPHVPADYGINHGGPERVAPRFAARDQVVLTEERSGSLYNLQWRSATTGEALMTIGTQPGHDFLGAFEVSPDGERVAAAWKDGVYRVWDAGSRTLLASIPTAALGWCEDLVFSSDSRILVTCGHDMKAQAWSVDDQHNLNLVPSSPPIWHPTQAVRVALSEDRAHLAVALWDGTICLWRSPEGPPIAYRFEAGGPTWPALSPDRRLVMPRGTSFRGGTLHETRIHDATTGDVAGPKLEPGGIVVDAAFSPDGHRVAIAALTSRTPEERNRRIFLGGGEAGNVQVWDWKTGRRLVGPVPMPSEPRGLAFRPDGRTLAVVCADYRVVLVRPQNGEVIHQLDPGIRTRPHNANLWTSNGEARFSPDGRFLLTWERVPILHVWDPDSGRLLRTLKHTERVENVAFNPAAPHILATGGRDSTIRVWDLDRDQLLARLEQPRWTQTLDFSPDGSVLISGCSDGLIRSWDWRTGTLNRGVPHDLSLIKFALTADRRILVALGGYSLEVTDWPRGTPLGPRWNLGDDIHWGVVIPAGDRRAIVGGFSGTFTGFDLEKMGTPTTGTTDELTRLAELAAGRRIMSQGSVVPISSSEWTERWEQLRGPEDPLATTRAASTADETRP